MAKPERQIVVKPIGLVTQPNKLGQFPAGALKQARDVVMRSPGEVHQAFLANQFVGSWAPTYGTFATKAQLVNIASHTPATPSTWYPYWVQSNGTRQNDGDMPGEVQRKFSATGRMGAIVFRDRLIINGDPSPPMVCDYPDPQTAAQRSFRYVGLPQPHLYQAFAATPGNAVKDLHAVSYACVAKRVFADGYMLISAPSVIRGAYNSAGSSQAMDVWAMFKDANGNSQLLEGDFIEVYRSQALIFASTNDVPDAGTTLYKVLEHPLTALEAANGFVQLLDVAAHSAFGEPLNGLGEELYTNPSQGGSGRQKLPPPSALCISNFRGRAWYSNCKLQGQFSAAFRGGFGRLEAGFAKYTVDARKNGVGLRLLVCTMTNGSVTVTGISAADMIGLQGGQSFHADNGVTTFTQPGTYIATTGVSSLTLTLAATGGGAATGYAEDQIEVNGVRSPVLSFAYQEMPYFVESARSVQPFGIVYNQQLRISSQRLSAFGTGEINVRGTNGQNYGPPIPAINQSPKVYPAENLKNYVRWSEDQQPEACPPTNELYVGSGEIYGVASTRDCQWYFCSDGLWRLSGTVFPINGIPDIRVDPVDPTLILAGPRAFCVLRDAVYAYTNRGFVRITDAGIEELSTGIIGDVYPGQPWVEALTPCLSADERVDEIHALMSDTSTPADLVYSARYNCWTTAHQWTTCVQGLYVPWLRAPAFVDLPGEVTAVLPSQTLHVSSSPTVEFQPLHAGKPDALKQWIDMILVFDSQASGTVIPLWNGVDIGAAGLVSPQTTGSDLRMNYGVPRDAPAIAPMIRPGYSTAGTVIRRFSGMSLRYVVLTEQAGERGA